MPAHPNQRLGHGHSAGGGDEEPRQLVGLVLAFGRRARHNQTLRQSVLDAPERIVALLENKVLAQPQRLRVVQAPGLPVFDIIRIENLIQAVGRAGVSVAFDVDGLMDQPNQLHRLAEGRRRFVGDFGADAAHFSQVSRAFGAGAPRFLAEERRMAFGPVRNAAQRMLGGCEKLQLLRRGFALAAAQHALDHATQAKIEQFAIAGAEVPLIRNELVLRLVGERQIDSHHRAHISSVAPPQVAVAPIGMDVLGNLALQISRPVRIFVQINRIFGDAEFDHQRHGAGRAGNGSGDAVAGTQIQCHCPQVLAQGQRLVHDPGRGFVFPKHARERLGAFEADAHRRIEDVLAQSSHIRSVVGFQQLRDHDEASEAPTIGGHPCRRGYRSFFAIGRMGQGFSTTADPGAEKLAKSNAAFFFVSWRFSIQDVCGIDLSGFRRGRHRRILETLQPIEKRFAGIVCDRTDGALSAP
ncbi:MAG: hypothetical protein BWZ10_02250 [candidate division BRC1 bacterium ADurb.BinA364]|nr:MAG: hypothetical protein BWZ10_02250 [candidate division BRC1 bacterium ADurb.BinA364]